MRNTLTYFAGALACLTIWATPVRGEAIWHTARTLQRGDEIRRADIIARDVERAPDNALRAADAIDGLEVLRRVAVGRPLTDRDIGPRRLVRAGQSIRVLHKTPALTLELRGRAMESGAAGEEVRVHNPMSGRTIRARVVAEGTAEIEGLSTP